MVKVTFDAESLWVISEYVRMSRNSPEYGQEHDRAFMLKVWTAIVQLTEHHSETGEQLEAVDVDFTEMELWQITRQVSAQLAVGSRKIGREVVYRAAKALLERDTQEVPDVPDVYRSAYRNANEDGASD